MEGGGVASFPDSEDLGSQEQQPVCYPERPGEPQQAQPR